MQRLARISTALLAIFALLAETMVPAGAQIAAPPQPEARFAFVIGSDGYEGAPLPTAANDAGLVAEALRSSGFDITGARNLDQDTLRASYREFIDKVAAAGPNAVAAVYLSGYGLQVEGENYLVPVGARVQRDTDVSLNAIRLSDMTRALGGQPGRAHMVMLDLAYDGPFGKQGQPLAPGLAIVEPEANTLIGFNTAPGAYAPIPKGDYGPYAQAISETFRIAGLPVDDIFARVRTRTAELSKSAQVPWHASRMDPNYELMERAPDAPALPVSPAQRQESRARPIKAFSEADAYAAALDRDTIEAYQDFLAVYPRSPYAKTVRGLLAARREALTWRRAAVTNTPNAYWSYLERYPRGPHATDARRRLARLAAPLQAPPGFDAIYFDEAPPPSSEDIYFEARSPYYFDDDALPPPRVSFMPPPPPWWAPPPPPSRDLYSDEVYFLPSPYEPPPPAWVRPPAYVAAPPMRESGGSILPYVAIPAALAAGIVAGKIISDRRRDAGVAPVGGQRPPGGPGGFGGPAQTGGQAGGAPRFMPPVATPPRPMAQIIQQQGQVSQPVAPPPTAPPQQGLAPAQPGARPGPGAPGAGIQTFGAPTTSVQPLSAPAPGAAPQIQQQQAPLPGQPRPPGQPLGQGLPPPPGAGAPPPAGALPRPAQPGLPPASAPAPGAAPQIQQQQAPIPGQPRPLGQPGGQALPTPPGAGAPPPAPPGGALPRPAQPGQPPAGAPAPGAAQQIQQQAPFPGQPRPQGQPIQPGGQSSPPPPAGALPRPAAPQAPQPLAQPPAQAQPVRPTLQSAPPPAPAPMVQQPRPVAPPPSAQPAPQPPAQQQQMLQRQQQEQQQRAQEQQRAQQQQMQQQQQQRAQEQQRAQQQQMQAEQQRRAQEQQRAQQQQMQQQQQQRAQEQQRAQQQQMQQQQQQQRAMEQQRAQQAAEQQRKAQEQQKARPPNCGNPGQPACPR